MTPATALLRRFEAAGITLWTDGGRVRYRGPKHEIDRALPELKKHKAELRLALTQPADLAAILTEACRGVEGIDAATFRPLLSPEDVTDILAGDIPAVPTLRAYAKSFASRLREAAQI